MTSMIDRVAKEVNRTAYGVGGSPKRAARAAMESLREPTPVMLKAGHHALRWKGAVRLAVFEQAHAAVWTAMINVALDE